MLLSFDEWCAKLLEDGEATAINSTSGIDQVSPPIGLVRRKMPQIKNHDAFMSDLKEQGIDVKSEKYPKNQYRPTQSELNPEKIKSLQGKVDTHPIIVSKDSYIVDGHHRWAAQDNVNALRVDMNHKDLLSMLKNKSYVSHEGL